MNAPVKNLLTFVAAAVVGVMLILANSAAGFIISPLTLAAAAYVGGVCLFVFGRPHEKLVQGQIGWGLFGLAAGSIAPFALLYVFMAG